MIVKDVLLNTVKSIETLRETTKSPVHALLWGKWGTGKTYAAQSIAANNVFYVKIPEGEITKSKLVKIFGISMGAGYRHIYEACLDMIRYHLIEKNIKHPIFILDEAQRIFKSKILLGELKDLSEDIDLRFSYIFLGDHTIPQKIIQHPHSLHKRILIKKELDGLTEQMITELAKHYKISVEPSLIIELGKERGWTTIDIAFIFSYIAKAKIEVTKENLIKISKTLGR